MYQSICKNVATGGLQELNLVFPLGAMGGLLCNSVFTGTLWTVTTANNESQLYLKEPTSESDYRAGLGRKCPEIGSLTLHEETLCNRSRGCSVEAQNQRQPGKIEVEASKNTNLRW